RGAQESRHMTDARTAPKAKPKPSEPKEPDAKETKAEVPAPAVEALGSGEELKNLQELSANMARAAMIAQGAIAEAFMKQAEHPSAMRTDPSRVGPAMTGVMGRLAAHPDKVLRAQAELFSGYMNLWQSTARRMAGEQVEPVIAPERGDK